LLYSPDWPQVQNPQTSSIWVLRQCVCTHDWRFLQLYVTSSNMEKWPIYLFTYLLINLLYFSSLFLVFCFPCCILLWFLSSLCQFL
jgi:hypothetical protein